jgi:hypothetical protein
LEEAEISVRPRFAGNSDKPTLVFGKFIEVPGNAQWRVEALRF